ncbi:MAG: hypothetical protein R3C11_25300 [Planctomycetaceae bacterium]
MLLEAVRLLDENIVASPAHVDMGMILGTGFPPFRGGLLRWCDNEGAANIVDRADKLAPLGKRFEVPDSLREMAKHDKKFYPIPKEIVEMLKNKHIVCLNTETGSHHRFNSQVLKRWSDGCRTDIWRST